MPPTPNTTGQEQPSALSVASRVSRMAQSGSCCESESSQSTQTDDVGLHDNDAWGWSAEEDAVDGSVIQRLSDRVGSLFVQVGSNPLWSKKV